MTWLDGEPLLDFKEGPLEDRNQIARAMFRAWWYPFSHHGVIHGDPASRQLHGLLGRRPGPAGINLLDYGCIRTFTRASCRASSISIRVCWPETAIRVVAAYEEWGFKGLNDELIDGLTIWARFIYGPLLDDRERTIADEVDAGRIRPARNDARAQVF